MLCMHQKMGGGEREREKRERGRERERERERGREITYTNSPPDSIIFNNGNLKHVHCTKIYIASYSIFSSC